MRKHSGDYKYLRLLILLLLILKLFLLFSGKVSHFMRQTNKQAIALALIKSLEIICYNSYYLWSIIPAVAGFY